MKGRRGTAVGFSWGTPEPRPRGEVRWVQSLCLLLASDRWRILGVHHTLPSPSLSCHRDGIFKYFNKNPAANQTRSRYTPHDFQYTNCLAKLYLLAGLKLNNSLWTKWIIDNNNYILWLNLVRHYIFDLKVIGMTEGFF